ncbi:MAG: hypothetical protein J7K33_09535 [Candidatus Marinimicrobia bacterium]|nr:hypothetical protein [Candidatus Neomarinimicrobiota bacterium]
MARKGRITELSLYPAIKNIFNVYGASAVQEVKFGTRPDLLVEWFGEKWLVSVKIGNPEKPKLLKEAMKQYLNHMLETGRKYGMIIFYLEEIRKTELSETMIEATVESTKAYFIVMNPSMELRKTLPDALEEIKRVL